MPINKDVVSIACDKDELLAVIPLGNHREVDGLVRLGMRV